MDSEVTQALRNSLIDASKSHFLSRCIYVVCKMNIPDLLINGSLNTSELASLTNSHEPSLYRILQMTTMAAGIFQEHDFKVFELTPTGLMLTAEHPQSIRNMVLFYGNDFFMKILDQLETCILTGESGLQLVHGESSYAEYFEKNSIGQLFGELMTSSRANALEVTANAIKLLPTDTTIMDIGGGHGSALVSILKSHAQLKTGVLLELSAVVERARELLNDVVKEGRLVFQAGDMFDPKSILPGMDIYLLQNILLDYPDDKVLQLLSNISTAIKAGARPYESRLLIIGDIAHSELGYKPTMDIIMLCIGGKIRTVEEYKILLRSTGFGDLTVATIPGTNKSIITTSIRSVPDS